jgi:serine/threonine-protein kinase RsbW
MQVSVSLHLGADVEAIPMARRLLLSTLDACDLDDSVAADLAVALSEACTNSVRHSGAPWYTAKWTVHDGWCEIEVRDEGNGFRRTRPAVMPDYASVTGRGIPLMQLLVDHVHIDALPGRGTTVRMHHRIRERARRGFASSSVG